MRLYLLLPLLFVAIAARAEEPAACAAFRADVLNKPRILRDFSADESRAYEMKAGALSSGEIKVREFAPFTAEKVKCSGTTLTMDGTRRFAVLDSMSHAVTQSSAGVKAKITVMAMDQPLDAALPKVVGLLFWASPKEAAASVPDYLAKSVPATFDSASKSYVSCAVCGTGKPYPESEGVILLSKNNGVTPPRLTKQVDPEFTEASRRQKNWHGEVLVGLIVGVDGKPHDIWIIHALGYGLDENAANAVSQYRFVPSTKDGRPVPVWLNLVVNFQEKSN